MAGADGDCREATILSSFPDAPPGAGPESMAPPEGNAEWILRCAVAHRSSLVSLVPRNDARRTACASHFLRRFQPGVFGLDQFVKGVLVEHAGFAEGCSRERIDHGVMKFKAAFRMLDHAPLDQLLVAE